MGNGEGRKRKRKEMKELTTEELAAFNGKDGASVYIAFEGKVYDVSGSPLWAKGTHMLRHLAGQDLTGSISAAPHGVEVFERYPQIGVLKKGPPEELKHLPTMLQGLLQGFPMARRHPHPMLVHFPIAFHTGTSFSTLLYLFFSNPSFELFSFYLLLFGSFTSIFAFISGLFTWWVNYRLKLTYLVKRKILFSIALGILQAVLIFWRSTTSEIANPIYFILMLLITPNVVLLGYYGGQITFPVEKKHSA